MTEYLVVIAKVLVFKLIFIYSPLMGTDGVQVAPQKIAFLGLKINIWHSKSHH